MTAPEQQDEMDVERWTVFIDTFGRAFDVEDGVSPYAGTSSTDGSRAVEVVAAEQLRGAVAVADTAEKFLSEMDALENPRPAGSWFALKAALRAFRAGGQS